MMANKPTFAREIFEIPVASRAVSPTITFLYAVLDASVLVDGFCLQADHQQVFFAWRPLTTCASAPPARISVISTVSLRRFLIARQIRETNCP